MTANELEWFDRGLRLGQRLPFGWACSYLATGVVIQRMNEHTLAYDDVLQRKWIDMHDAKGFQELLDEISEMMEPVEREECHANISGF